MNDPIVARRLPIGAEIISGGVHFRVWATKCRHVAVHLFDEASVDKPARCEELTKEPGAGGYYSATIKAAAAGMLYGYCLDGSERLWPDPASRFQPQGPEGLSQVVDPSSFLWTDATWQGVAAQGQVIYELHLGTYTQEGTWEAASREIEELATLGITVVEVMPVADFPGQFGWGYDGVNFFAPTRLYGPPDAFRRFVDRAHALGVGVILDVVYNHFGNFSNYLGEFSETYASQRYANAWGTSNNFDGPGAQGVREFFLANVRYWIEEFHIDGYRFDATQAMQDASNEHILATLANEARRAAGKRQVLLVAESEPQDAQLVRPTDAGGQGMDMIWNDDFHHAAVVRLTGHNEAYYSDFLGGVEEFLACLKHGFLYQGQYSRWQGKPRGTPTRGVPQYAIVNYLQTHDQVSNSACGTRLHRLTSPGRLRAMTVLWLLSPQTPLFFQGQEFAASADFVFFADHAPEHRRMVAEGRLGYLCQFPSINTAEMRDIVPDPGERATFERCRLDFAERQTHAAIYALHRDLLRLRREDPVFRSQRGDRIDAAPYGSDALIVRYFGEQSDDRLLLVNFGRDCAISPAPQPLLAPPVGQFWQLVFSSEWAEYGGRGSPPLERETGWFVPGESAVVLKSAASDQPR